MTITEHPSIKGKEKEINELRSRVKEFLPEKLWEDRTLLYNFLKARNFNIKQAECMLKKHLDWRNILQLEHILTDFECPEVLNKYVSQSLIGLDKNGNIVRYSALGNIDGRGVLKSANKQDVLKCCLQCIETDMNTLRANAKQTGEPMAQCIYIYDMDNLTLANATDVYSIDLFKIGIGIFQDNYPELLKAIYVINAVKYFAIAFPLIKVVLANSIIGKVQVFGREGYQEELLKIIDPEVLPAFLGGSRTDPAGDPLCKAFINRAGPVPRSYYLTKDIAAFAKSPNVKRVVVKRQSSFTFDVEVVDPKSIFEFEIEAKEYDIAIKIGLKTDSKIIELIPFIRIETDYKPHKGILRCKQAGTYIVTFDNTYSLIHSKEIYYRFALLKQDEKIFISGQTT